MRKKRVSTLVAALTCCTLLAGCGGSTAEIAELKNIEALNTESELVNVNMSVNEKEAAIYAQVSNRTLLDLSSLDAVPSSDKDAVVSYMDSVDAQLCGTLSADDGVIDSCYTDYLLTEFERTPYYWQRSSMNIRGMDASSRSIVVDVTYKTIDFKKDVKAESTIVMGEPNYDTKLKVRYERWLSILEKLYGFSGGGGEEESAQQLKQSFEDNYGKVDDIIAEQRDLTPTQDVYETGNQKTYTGPVSYTHLTLPTTSRV